MLKRLWTTLAVALLVMGAGISQSLAEKRVALVVGNGKYEAAVALPNPANDAKLIASTLRGIGFEVIEAHDADRITMIGLIDRFTEKAYTADLAMIYYAGHGMQVDGKNYLIPVDAELTSVAHLKTRTIDMSDLLDALPVDPGVGILIIDACRDNPLARSFMSYLPASRSAGVSSGLAAVQTTNDSTAGGLLIGYATDPGAVALDGEGTNSPYTAALARHLATPGVNIHSVLTRVRNDVTTQTEGKQRPWYNASLGREVYLGGTRAPSVDVNHTPVETAVSPVSDNTDPIGIDVRAVGSAPVVTEAEQSFWDQVVTIDDAEAYKLYLLKYPDGHFSPLARAMVAKLEAEQQGVVETASLVADDAAATSEPEWQHGTEETFAALNLDRGKRIELQLRLRALEHEPKGIDGSIGPNSRKAIGAWQRTRGMPETGYLTERQYLALLEESEPAFTAVQAEHQRQISARRAAQKTRSASARRTTSNKRRSSSRNSAPNGAKEFGSFVAGVAAGAVGCKLLGC